MPSETIVTTTAQVIQLAVAPVFLLTGVAAFLAVLTSRLARVVDRARYVEGTATQHDAAVANAREAELRTLRRRARLMNAAISLCTVSALLVCGVIVMLFLDAFLHHDSGAIVAALFILAMVCLIVALLCFLREIFIATMSLLIGGR